MKHEQRVQLSSFFLGAVRRTALSQADKFVCEIWHKNPFSSTHPL